jgi:hypothetical protein
MADFEGGFLSLILYPALQWSADHMCEVTSACVTMQNMIIKSGRGAPWPPPQILSPVTSRV